MKRIFISSVQKEFERERAAIKRMIEADPIVRTFGSRKTGHWEFQQRAVGFDVARGAGLEAEVAPTLTTQPSACVFRVAHSGSRKGK